MLLITLKKMYPSNIKKLSRKFKSLPTVLKQQVAHYQVHVNHKYKYIKYLCEYKNSEIDKILVNNDIKNDSVTNIKNINNKNCTYFINNYLTQSQKIELSTLDLLITEKNHLKILNFLDRSTIPFQILRYYLKSQKYNKFKSIETYIQSNLYVPDIVSTFLDHYKDYLPDDIITTLVLSKINLKCIAKLLSKMIIHNKDIILQEDVLEKLMELFIYKSCPCVYNILVYKCLFKNCGFLYKYVKRDDYEFYLRILCLCDISVKKENSNLNIDGKINKKINKYENYTNKEKLEYYLNNQIESNHKFYPHMLIYNSIKNNILNFVQNDLVFIENGCIENKLYNQTMVFLFGNNKVFIDGNKNVNCINIKKNESINEKICMNKECIKINKYKKDEDCINNEKSKHIHKNDCINIKCNNGYKYTEFNIIDTFLIQLLVEVSVTMNKPLTYFFNINKKIDDQIFFSLVKHNKIDLLVEYVDRFYISDRFIYNVLVWKNSYRDNFNIKNGKSIKINNGKNKGDDNKNIYYGKIKDDDNIIDDINNIQNNLKTIIDKYKDTNLKNLVFSYLSTSQSFLNIFNTSLSLFPDERSPYLEILSQQVLQGKFHISVFNYLDYFQIIKMIVKNIKDFEIYNILLKLVDNEKSNNKNKININRNFFKDLLTDYSINFYPHEYITNVDQENCTIEEGINLFKILCNSKRETIGCNINFNTESHLIYYLGTNKKIDDIECCDICIEHYIKYNNKKDIKNICINQNKAENSTNIFIVHNMQLFCYLLYKIRYNDGLCIFYKFYEYFILSYINKSLEYLEIMNYLKSPYILHSINIEPYLRNLFKSSINLKKFNEKENNKNNFIQNTNSNENFNSFSLDHSYIHTLFILLADSNKQVVNSSRMLLLQMKLNPDLELLKSQIINSYTNKMTIQNTLYVLFNLQYNYMIDIYSIKFIIELVRISIKEYKEMVFKILKGLYNIVEDKEWYVKEVFCILNLFVVNNNFCIDECVNVMKEFVSRESNDSKINDKKVYVDLDNNQQLQISDFQPLIENIDKDLRISYFIVQILKLLNNTQLSIQIIKILKNNLNFLSHAFDLEIFQEYLPEYFDKLKDIYNSKDNKIAIQAFSKLSGKEKVYKYLVNECFINSGNRICSLEIINNSKIEFDSNKEYSKETVSNINNVSFQSNIPVPSTILYIFKYDSNQLVRKKVAELLKGKIENYNILIKNYWKNILGLLNKYYEYIPDTSVNVVRELVSKYYNSIDIEYCVKQYDNILSEILFVEGLKKEKWIDACRIYIIEKGKNIIEINRVNCDEEKKIICDDISYKYMNKICGINDDGSISEDIFFKNNTNKISKYNHYINYKLLEIFYGIDKQVVFEYLYILCNYSTNNYLQTFLENNSNIIYNLVMYNLNFLNKPFIIELLNEKECKELLKLDLSENIKKMVCEKISVEDLNEYDVDIIYLWLINNCVEEQDGIHEKNINKYDKCIKNENRTIKEKNTSNTISTKGNNFTKNTSNSIYIELYKRVFIKMDNDKLQSLILPCNYSYLLEVSYKNITDYSSLIDVLSTNQNIRSIERLSEIWTVCQDERIIDYLMYCYLIYELRSYCKRLLCDIKDYVGGVKREIIDILII